MADRSKRKLKNKDVEDIAPMIEEVLEKEFQSSLLGRAIDISKSDGREEFAQWFVDLCVSFGIEKVDIR